MQFDATDIARHFDPGTQDRGADYARKGRVLGCHWENGQIIGDVRGSGHERYRQWIRPTATAHGVSFDGSCSCYVGYKCKHMVATLLVCVERGLAHAGMPAGGLAQDAERWLDRLVQLRESTRADDASFELFWVLMPMTPLGAGRMPAPRLYPGKMRRRKDGGLALVAVPANLDSMLASPPAWITPEDLQALRLFVGARAGDYVDSTGAWPGGQIASQLLRLVCARGKLLWTGSAADLRRGDGILLQAGPRRHAATAWTPSPDDPQRLRLGWRFDDGAEPDYVMPTEPPAYLAAGLLGELALAPELAALPVSGLLDVLSRAPSVPAEARAGLAARLSQLGLERIVPAPATVALHEHSGVAPVPVLYLGSYLVHHYHGRHEHAYFDHARLEFEYDGISTEGVEDADEALRRPLGNAVEVIRRDADAERAALDMLAADGFLPADAAPLLDAYPESLQLPDESAWVVFARQGVPRLEAAGWRVIFDGDYRYELIPVQDWYAELDEDGEGINGWFALELGIVVEGERHALLPLLLDMIRRAPHDFAPAAIAARPEASEFVVELSNFERVALPWRRVAPILATLGELYFSERFGKAIRLPFIDAARLAELERAAQLRWVGGERLREIGRKLGAFDGIAPATPPASLQAELRPYQRSGLAWLQFLREYGFGGILADDMGLGKTIQTLAHILTEKESGRLDRPALVVAPTSLMPNWQAEAARFAPGLRVLLLHGKDRSALFDQIDGADLVLTTYPLLSRDEDKLRAHRYHLLILDEAQYIKNSRSKASQTARLLDARHRLCLTGTPVQNHLGELWSQFHFLMPGLLGDDKSFNAAYRKPIEQGGDSARKDLLVRRVKPFMLRRTKDKVATELPPKTEIVLPVELGGAQRDLYETVRVAMNKKVRDEIDRKGLARSHILILDALLKLRQVCCDPRLVKRDGAPVAAPSAKLEALLELLDTLHSEGRRVLVFSQFTSMLALIGDELRARGRDYVVLTGDTLDRAAPVAAFQGGQAGVFLISLKAGGVGLNLTAADTVIHYDPWWNPATENQATDRAWRIGQSQPVFVYKLIARGTLEEKIQEMQWRKAELANAVLASETELAPGIGADDLREIFTLSPA